MNVVEANQIMELIGECICEIEDQMVGDAYDGGLDAYPGEWEEIGWDDVKGVALPARLVRSGRLEEVVLMESQNRYGMCAMCGNVVR